MQLSYCFMASRTIGKSLTLCLEDVLQAAEQRALFSYELSDLKQ